MSILYSTKQIFIGLPYPSLTSISRVCHIYPRADILSLGSTEEFEKVHESLAWYGNPYMVCKCMPIYILSEEGICNFRKIIFVKKRLKISLLEPI